MELDDKTLDSFLFHFHMTIYEEHTRITSGFYFLNNFQFCSIPNILAILLCQTLAQI